MTFICTGKPKIHVTCFIDCDTLLWWSVPTTSLRYVCTQPQVASGYHIGQHWLRTFPSSQKFYSSDLALFRIDPTSPAHTHLEKAAKWQLGALQISWRPTIECSFILFLVSAIPLNNFFKILKAQPLFFSFPFSTFFSEWEAIAGKLHYNANITSKSGELCRDEARERALDGQDWTLGRNNLISRKQPSHSEHDIDLHFSLRTRRNEQWSPHFLWVHLESYLASAPFFLFPRLWGRTAALSSVPSLQSPLGSCSIS